MTDATLRARLSAARVAHLATADAAGHPHLVPIVFALLGERLVTAVDAKPKRSARLRRLDNVRANPRVSVLADHYDEDWTRLWWVRADGHARIVAGGAEHDEAVLALQRKYEQYAQDAPTGPAIVVTVERLSGWGAV